MNKSIDFVQLSFLSAAQHPGPTDPLVLLNVEKVCCLCFTNLWRSSVTTVDPGISAAVAQHSLQVSSAFDGLHEKLNFLVFVARLQSGDS